MDDMNWRSESVDKRLAYALLNGIDQFIIEDVEEARLVFGDSLQVIEGPLQKGMDVLVNLFSAGKIFLPQIIKSSSVMKKSIAYLSQYLEAEKKSIKKKGKIILATVRGDVHDIGKNIVGAFLSCHNYQVIDLGTMVSCKTIITAAKQTQADIIGLSGLIISSLEEMIYVAKEMQKQQLFLPLLIGGATTSRAHTAIQIEKHYAGPTIHIVDISQAILIINQLLDAKSKESFIKSIRDEYTILRKRHQNKKKEMQLVSLEEARQNKFTPSSVQYTPVKPSFLGTQSFVDHSLEELIPYIDWTPFFHSWGLLGKYPSLLADKEKGKSAEKLFADAQHMLAAILTDKWLTAHAVIGFFPANSVGDDIEVYSDENRDRVIATFRMLRQQMYKPDERNNFCLADYIFPKTSEVADYIGGFALTTGHKIENKLQEFAKKHDDYSAIMLKAVSDSLVDAFAEYMVQKVDKEFWPFPDTGRYRGIRPGPGYPACPDHTEKPLLFSLLNATKHTGIRLTEHFSMLPAASLSGFYLAHPEARYFGVGKIGEDQLEDYAKRKNMDSNILRRWLAKQVENF